MIFQSAFRKELAKNFGTTLVVLVTIIMTMTLTKTLGDASRGVFKPSDIFIIMGFIVLSELPILLSACLFIAIMSTLTRMYADSEMVVWQSCGIGLSFILRPIIRFAWPIVFIIFAMALIVLPWAFNNVATLQAQFSSRSDINRIEPGQFKEVADGKGVFYIDTQNSKEKVGKNVFVQLISNDKKTVLSAEQGKIVYLDKKPYFELDNGHAIQKDLQTGQISVSKFGSYAVSIPDAKDIGNSFIEIGGLPSMELLTSQNPQALAELAWRLSQGLVAINFIFIAVAAARFKPRAGKFANLAAAILIFLIYFNLMMVGKSWVETQKISFLGYLIGLHVGTFTLAMLWLASGNIRTLLAASFKKVAP